jgi:hypothetical protein
LFTGIASVARHKPAATSEVFNGKGVPGDGTLTAPMGWGFNCGEYT